MELWLILAIISYLFFAISTSIDKYMMNTNFDIIHTNTFKMFFDGVILFIIGILFFRLLFDKVLIFWSVILGLLYASSGIIYYYSLKLKDVEEVMPSIQSLEILLIFVFAVLLFSEIVNMFNYIGIALILFGVYAVLSTDKLQLPKIDRGTLLIFLVIVLNIIYYLLVKSLLSEIKPINLAIMMYFSSTLVLLIYQFIFKKNFIKSTIKFKKHIPTVIIAAFFGALGTFLLYSALTIGNASKVYPIAGIQSVFIFIIASTMLKEKFYWHRFIGTLSVVLGIFFVSI